MRRRLAIVLGAGLSLVLAAGPATAVSTPPAPQPAEPDVSTLTGTVEILTGDDFAAGESLSRAQVVTDDGQRVEIPAEEAHDLVGGTSVQVTTDSTGDVLGVAPLVAPAGTVAAPDKGTHELVFIPVTSSSGTSTPKLDAAGFAALVGRVNTYYSTTTKGAIKVTTGATVPATVSDTVITGPTDAYCNADALKQAATAAAKAKGITSSRFRHFIIAVPDQPGCTSLAGLGSVGPAADGTQTIWLFGSEGVPTQVLAHELGHNFGLSHSDRVDATGCTITSPTSALAASCFDEYYDPWELMGGGFYTPDRTNYVGHLSASHLDQMGLLPAAEKAIPNGKTTQTFRLSPVAQSTVPAGARRLISIPYGSRLYTVEYRTAVGYDSWINTPSPLGTAGTGVVIRVADANRGYQESAYPASASSWAWQAGQKFTAGKLSIAIGTPSGGTVPVTVTRDVDVTKPAISSYGYPYSYWTISGRGDLLKRTDLQVGANVADTGSAVAYLALIVDGKERVRTPRPATEPILKYAVRNGRHTWQLVARDVFGNTVSTTTRTVYVDTSKPKVTAKPAAWLTNGTVSTKTVPVRVRWGMSDACGFMWTGVQGTNGLDKSYNKAVTSVASRLTFSRSTQFRFRAQDCAGNLTALTTGSRTTATLVSTPSSKAYKGSWSTVKGSKYLGKSAKVSKKKGASVSYKVKTRSLGVVVTKGKGYGKAYVYIDGKKAATVNLSASRTTYGQLVYSKTWSRAGTHTIKVVAASSKKVVVDGFVRLS